MYMQEHHLPPQKECHYDEHNAEAAKYDSNEHSKIIVIMGLT